MFSIWITLEGRIGGRHHLRQAGPAPAELTDRKDRRVILEVNAYDDMKHPAAAAARYLGRPRKKTAAPRRRPQE